MKFASSFNGTTIPQLIKLQNRPPPDRHIVPITALALRVFSTCVAREALN